MKKLLPLLALLSACNPVRQPLFISKCGLIFQGLPEEKDEGVWPATWTPESLQHAEDATLEHFAEVTDPRFKNTCSLLKGWTIYYYPAADWWDSYHRHISGVTICQRYESQINKSTEPIHSSLPHELAHVVQRCDAPGPNDPGQDADHANWSRDGIYRALDEIWRTP